MTNPTQTILAQERDRIRAALAERLIGAIPEPEHSADLLCWCMKRVQRVDGTGIVAHGTVDEFIRAALDDVLGKEQL
jgi:hypothetical protein